MGIFTFPASTVTAGVPAVVGPFAMADHWDTVELAVDLTNLPNNETVTLTVEFTTDGGTNWEVIARVQWTGGPWTDKNGANHPNLGTQHAYWSGSLPDRRGQGRLMVDSTASFVQGGGSLTLRAR